MDVRREARLWLEQAEAELRAAIHALEAGDWFAAVFWSHQTAEKALKALLIASGIARRDHNLLALLEHAEKEAGIEPPPDVARCARQLNPHYMVSRYPDAANGVPFQMYERSDAEKAIECARRVLEWVKQLLR